MPDDRHDHLGNGDHQIDASTLLGPNPLSTTRTCNIVATLSGAAF